MFFFWSTHSPMSSPPPQTRFFFDQVNFYIDIEGHIENPPLQKALEELGFHTQKLDVLGVYKAHEFRFQSK